MMLSELAGKEIINLHDGSRVGLIGDSDIRINSAGKIEALLVSSRWSSKWLFNKGGESEGVVIPWSAVKKIGNEVIIVDLPANTI